MLALKAAALLRYLSMHCFPRGLRRLWRAMLAMAGGTTLFLFLFGASAAALAQAPMYKTPEPAADATDAVVPARTTEGFELLFAVRDCDPETELPAPPAPRFVTPPANHRELLDRLYASYASTEPLEYPDALDDHTAVFLSRLLIRLGDVPATDLTRHASGDVAIKDEARPIVLPGDLLATLLPMP